MYFSLDHRRATSLRLLTLALIAGLFLASSAVSGHAAEPDSIAESAWQLEVPEHDVVAGSHVKHSVVTQARPPYGNYDRVRLHRYRRNGTPFATMIYLPGTHMNGVSMITDESHNLWLYLAARGVEVFALDYRTHAIPP